MKEPSQFLPLLPDSSPFFPNFPDFSPLFPDFWQIFRSHGWLSAPLTPPVATPLLITLTVLLWVMQSYHTSPVRRIISLACINIPFIKGVLHPWTLFLKTLCIFSKNKATSDKVSYGSGQKCSKELKNHSFTSVETIVVQLQ